MQNVSFVAQVVDWVPEVLYNIVSAAFHHKGLSFVRIIQRCPEWLPNMFEPWMQDPLRLRMLTHANGIKLSDSLARVTRTRKNTIRRISIGHAKSVRQRSDSGRHSVRNEQVPCYEDLRASDKLRTPEYVKRGLNAEFDKFTIWPEASAAA